MDHFQKTVTKTGYGEARINKTKKILLIGGAKSDALSNRQQTHRLFHCDSVLQAWDLVYRYPPEVIVLNLDNSDGTALSFAGMPGVSGTRPDHRGGPGSPDTASHEGAGIPRLGGDSDRHRYWKASVRSSKAWGSAQATERAQVHLYEIKERTKNVERKRFKANSRQDLQT